MEGMIMLPDALSIMTTTGEDGKFLPFDGEFVTCNLKDGTGGERMGFTGAVLAGAPFGKKHTPKNANHFANATRNIMVPGRSRPISIHIYLLTRFNGERVIA